MFVTMKKITSKLRAILALLRGILCKAVHCITCAVNPLYRALYDLLEADEAHTRHAEMMACKEIGNDMYYSSCEYKEDDKESLRLFKRIKNLREKVKEIKKKGY